MHYIDERQHERSSWGSEVVKIEQILAQIDLGAMALPEFQRGYVWNRDQVRGLMNSLYRGHPVGSLLVWSTKAGSAQARGDSSYTTDTVIEMLLDGQQRITSLYGIMRGRPPRFFDGDKRAFSDLYFNLEDETFEFYAALKMKDNPLWVNVTTFMQEGMGSVVARLATNSSLATNLQTYLTRLGKLDQIKNIDLHIEKVTGEDKTIGVVVDIFNRVNSGGTKLSNADLALAKICAEWPEARNEMKVRLRKWERAGFRFRLEWLLRCMNAVTTGEALFTAFGRTDTSAIQLGLKKSEKQIDATLNLISSRLGLDHDDVLPAKTALAVLVRYLDRQPKEWFPDFEAENLALYWYVNCFIWGRYAGSTEAVLNQDLDAIEEGLGAFDRLISILRQQHGQLSLTAENFVGWSRGARFYPFLYLLTRVTEARDLRTGIPLKQTLLGKQSRLEVHHIFPKARLYKHGYSLSEVNAIANFSFLTQATNLEISDRDPAEYFAHYETRHPGALASHWIPMDRSLWHVENYREFLAARRELLAKSANEFLTSLLTRKLETPPEEVATPVLERPASEITTIGQIASDDEEAELLACNAWVERQGLPVGEIRFELVSPDTNDPVAYFDLAWPNGLQEGLSAPVALLIDEGEEAEAAANRAGFRFFTNVDEFKRYVEQQILTLDAVAD